jgi:hypothetical protein
MSTASVIPYSFTNWSSCWETSNEQLKYGAALVGLTLMGARASIICSGTLVPHNFVRRRNDENVCIGIMPGITGTVMPSGLGEK